MSLNRETREQERAADDERRLGIVNARLEARGEPLVESIDEWNALSQVENGALIDAPTTVAPITDSESNEESDQGPLEDNPLDDPMLRETGRILLDYIGLNQQVAMVEGEDASTP